LKLLENAAKDWLRGRGLPVPAGGVAVGAAEAGRLARDLGGPIAVKALVAAGRRGKAGAVKLARNADEAAMAAEAILGMTIAGQVVRRVYIEQGIEIVDELYLSFAFGDLAPRMLASRAGGVDIEQVFTDRPDAIAVQDIDPTRGLKPWDAVALWERAGVNGQLLPKLAQLTCLLYAAFVAGDALMLELNPIAVTKAGDLVVVGTMMDIDDSARFRQPQWKGLVDEAPARGRQLNERELAVVEANEKYPGGAVRYNEVEGNIGLVVAGGGASLLQHDMIVALGGRPANHSDFSPTPTPDKPAAVISAIFSNLSVRGLLIGQNYLQMAPCDIMIRALLQAMDRHNIDPKQFPIVIRLFGPKEAEARALAASKPGIRYLPATASLADGCQAIVAAVERATATERVS